MMLLSLHEPWATLMALGFKRVETRDWSTSYRGPLAIHASKHGMGLQRTLDTCLQPLFFSALQAYEPFQDTVMRHWPGEIRKAVMKDAFPNRGKIVCVVNLLNTFPTEFIRGRYPEIMTPAEFAFGNYEALDAESAKPRQGWVTEMLFRLSEPIPFTSKQGLVHVPGDVHAELKRQWNQTGGWGAHPL